MTDTDAKNETKSALVIGGTGAIGQAIAEKLASDGFSVVVASRSAADAPETSSAAGSMVLDITDAEQVQKAFAEYAEKYSRLDLLVNAVGVPLRRSPLLRLSLDDWELQQALHSRGTLVAAQQAGKLMKKQRSGRIVNIASLAAISPVEPGHSAYAVAKAAMVSLNQCLNQELNQYGVQSTAVCPTYVETPVWAEADMDKSKMLQPEDVASVVSFLGQLPAGVRIESMVLEAPASRS